MLHTAPLIHVMQHSSPAVQQRLRQLFTQLCRTPNDVCEITQLVQQHQGIAASPAQLALEPTVDWAAGLGASWQPGAQGAAAQLHRFLDEALAAYGSDRHRPDLVGSSRLSPPLHFGELSPRQVWQQVQERLLLQKGVALSAETYLRELGWREFAYHLLYHFPHTTDTPLREEFSAFPWHDDPPALQAWQPSTPYASQAKRQRAGNWAGLFSQLSRLCIYFKIAIYKQTLYTLYITFAHDVGRTGQALLPKRRCG